MNLKAIAGRWVHSHEEDTGNRLVFRRPSHHFPPSRGRFSFEIAADDTLVESRIGPADKPEPASGRWTLTDEGVLELVAASAGKVTTRRRFRVLSAEPDRLVVEKA